MQPYKCVVVRSQERKERLSEGMLAANEKRILQAPVSVVFASDLGRISIALLCQFGSN